MSRADLVRLVEANAPLWGGEAEVFRAYWDGPGRSPRTDRAWVRRQAYKEFFDGYAPHARQIGQRWASTGGEWPVADALEALEVAREELQHFAAFSSLYTGLGGDPADLTPTALGGVNWPENEALGRLRARHRAEHGAIGVRAQWFTEGGYATLYREGAALAGRGGADDAIAAVCARVLADEIDHMLAGVSGLAGADLATSEWDLLIALTTAQCRLRIAMRDAQFGRPLSPQRLQALMAGEGEALAFDWERAAR